MTNWGVWRIKPSKRGSLETEKLKQKRGVKTKSWSSKKIHEYTGGNRTTETKEQFAVVSKSDKCKQLLGKEKYPLLLGQQNPRHFESMLRPKQKQQPKKQPHKNPFPDVQTQQKTCSTRRNRQRQNTTIHPFCLRPWLWPIFHSHLISAIIFCILGAHICYHGIGAVINDIVETIFIIFWTTRRSIALKFNKAIMFYRKSTVLGKPGGVRRSKIASIKSVGFRRSKIATIKIKSKTKKTP